MNPIRLKKLIKEEIEKTLKEDTGLKEIDYKERNFQRDKLERYRGTQKSQSHPTPKPTSGSPSYGDDKYQGNMTKTQKVKEAKLDTPNPEVNDLAKQVMAVLGFKSYQMEIITAYNEYFINLPVKAIPLNALIRLIKILPEGSSFGVWDNLNSGALSIRTPYQVN